MNCLPTCSYKFCKDTYNCKFNYGEQIEEKCFQDHYVHKIWSANLFVLISYIKQIISINSNNKNNICKKEILTAIKTLSFVINHMENELKAKSLYLDDLEVESCHIILIGDYDYEDNFEAGECNHFVSLKYENDFEKITSLIHDDIKNWSITKYKKWKL